ncbi:MAG: acyltransferase [Acetobacteraceae bacterium]|nr:acyltransferase [Acetobacteraceae bacterium]
MPIDVYTLLALVLSVSCAIALTRLRVFAWADAPPDHAKRRVSNLDGLRGFVALAVVIHHGGIYRHYFLTGRWELFSSLNSMLGQGGVAMFFMLTGYLFWRRLVLAEGRIDWLRLYIGRVFRIGPIFLLTSAIAVVVSLHGGRHVHPGALLLAKQIGHYLFLGILPAVSVRGYDTGLLLALVTWTLAFEWKFYACLPLLAVLARRRLHVLFAAILFLWPLLAIWGGISIDAFDWRPALVCMFAAGALTASLQVSGIVPRTQGLLTSALATGLLVYALLALDSSSSPGAILVLAALFYLVATGCSMFGVLQMRSAHRLGHISYGIYLMQGLALAAVLRPLHRLSAASPVLHVLLVGLASALLVFMALLAHRWVELPGMRWGDRVARWACGRRDRFLGGFAQAGAGSPSE